MTHCPFIGWICATYDTNRSNRHGAMKRTLQKLQTTCMTWPFDLETVCDTSWVVFTPYIKWIGQIGTEQTCDLDLLTWKWCVMHRPSMGFICASYEVNRSNSHGADITKTSNNPYDFHHLPFDLEMVLMTCFWATYQSVKLAGRQSGYGQNFQRACVTCTFDPLKWKWCVTHQDFMGCICTTYKTNLSNRQQATEQTWQKLRTTRDLNFEQPVWSWSLAFWPGNGVWHIIISWVIFVQNMKGISQIGTEPWSRHDKNFEQSVWPLTFQPDVLCKFHENPMIGTCQKKLWRTDGHTYRQIKPFL